MTVLHSVYDRNLTARRQRGSQERRSSHISIDATPSHILPVDHHDVSRLAHLLYAHI